MATTSVMSNAAGSTPVPNYEHAEDLRQRTALFANLAVALCEDLLAAGGAARILAPQLIKSATAPHAMIEEAQSAESDADFLSKMSIALKELRESKSRLSLLHTRRIGPVGAVAVLVKESDELVRIVATIVAKKRENAIARSTIQPRARSRRP